MTRRHRVGAAGQRRRHVPAPGHLRGRGRTRRDRGGRLQRRRPDRPGRRQLRRQHRVGAAGQRRRHVRRPPDSSPPPLMPRPWWPTSTATAPTMSWSSTAPGTSSIARASPGSPAPSSRPSRSTPAIPSRDIAWVPNTGSGPGARQRRRPGRRRLALRLPRRRLRPEVGSLATGQLPAQIIAADLNGDGLTDLVVRNAGDGTLSVFFGTAFDRSSFVGPIDPSSIPRNSCRP